MVEKDNRDVCTFCGKSYDEDKIGNCIECEELLCVNCQDKLGTCPNCRIKSIYSVCGHRDEVDNIIIRERLTYSQAVKIINELEQQLKQQTIYVTVEDMIIFIDKISYLYISTTGDE